MNDRNRASPIALAGNTPVAQTEIDFAFPNGLAVQHHLFQAACDVFARLGGGHAIEKTRIDHEAVAVIGHVINVELRGVFVGRTHDRRDTQTIGVNKIQITLVMGRTAEDGARAIIHQNEIGDINRNFPIGIKRMKTANAGIKSFFLRFGDGLLRRSHALAFLDKGLQGRIIHRCGFGQGMVGRKSQKFGPKQCVRTRCVNFQRCLLIGRCFGFEGKPYRQAF